MQLVKFRYITSDLTRTILQTRWVEIVIYTLFGGYEINLSTKDSKSHVCSQRFVRMWYDANFMISFAIFFVIIISIFIPFSWNILYDIIYESLIVFHTLDFNQHIYFPKVCHEKNTLISLNYKNRLINKFFRFVCKNKLKSCPQSEIHNTVMGKSLHIREVFGWRLRLKYCFEVE